MVFAEKPANCCTFMVAELGDFGAILRPGGEQQPGERDGVR
jgi:hypothetical protein